MTAARTTYVGGLRRDLAGRLERAFATEGRKGTPVLDARLLLAHALGVDASTLALHDDDPVDSIVEARASALVERRIAGEPVARIVGRQEFWGLDLAVGPDTLVPRPDTETIVEAALGFVDRRGRREAALKLLDIGTGSGAILLALLAELPEANGVGVDLAPSALGVARENARRLGLAKRARFVAGDWATAVVGQFDLILSNPPYVESGAISRLQIEVRAFDPHLALDGGPDGLDAYRAILGDLGRLLASRGHAFFEVGVGQAADVAVLAGNQGFSAAFHRDLGGIERVVEVRRVGDD